MSPRSKLESFMLTLSQRARPWLSPLQIPHGLTAPATPDAGVAGSELANRVCSLNLSQFQHDPHVGVASRPAG